MADEYLDQLWTGIAREIVLLLFANVLHVRCCLSLLYYDLDPIL